ncbi:MAG: hypothetical protein ABI893_17935 [Polaromonas sp.]
MDEALRNGIGKAMSTRGSFYSASQESGLIVIPALGLAVLSYEG